MSKLLHIGKGFSLPLDLVTSTQAILARKRSGKSYTASVEAEEMLAAGQQIGVIDPTGAWWGLRSSADGSGAGFSIVVFGGDHEDAPLDSRAGKAMAAAFVEHGFSAIFDIGNFSTEDQLQFVTDFCAELLRINREAIHLFVDEADTFAPQTPRSVMANKCLGTVSRLVKQGGIRGVGFTMITQRSASINWDILSQIDLLTILRMSAPHDIDPVVKWLQSETSKEFAAEVRAALPALPVGTAFFASAPLKIAKRVEIRTRKTFNSGATPKPGERRAEPRVLATVDIERLGAEIAASVKEARENSVEALQARIRELESNPAVSTEREMELLEQLSALQQQANRVPELEAEAQRLRDKAHAIRAAAGNAIRELQIALEDTSDSFTLLHASEYPIPTGTPSLPERPVLVHAREVPVADLRKQYPVIHDGINPPQQKILDAMATLHSVRGARVSLEWIACTAGTTPRARGFEENMRQLKAKGLVDGINLTEKGRAVAVAQSTPPTFHAVLQRLSKALSAPQVAMLQVLKRSRLEPTHLADALGTTERARGFEENVRQLKKREFISLSDGVYRLCDWLERLP